MSKRPTRTPSVLLWLAVPASFACGPLAAAESGREQRLPPVDVVTPSKKKTPAAKAANAAPGGAPKAGAASGGGGSSGQGIVALVNDEPITAYEVEQRQRVMSLSGGNIQEKAQQTFKALIQSPATSERLKKILQQIIEANRGRSREEIIALFEERKKQFALSLQKEAVESARRAVLPGLRKASLDELIDERLKLQEAKRLNVLAPDEEVERIISGLAGRNKMTVEQFAQHLKSIGTDIGAMRDRFRADLSWRDVIRLKFRSQVAISERDIDRFVAQAPGSSDEYELQVQRITLPLSGKLGQEKVVARMREAETLRSRASGCATAAELAKSVPGARHENPGAMRASAIPEPTRSLLLTAQDGDMLPPTLSTAGVELWLICGRKTIAAAEKKREQAQEELRQKEFELLSAGYLKNLRQDAHIEYR